MSTLKVTNIAGLTGSSTNVVEGLAKAWANADANAATITSRDSLNVSSWTDYGTASYGVTLTNSMANTNYSFFGTGEAGGSQNCPMMVYNKDADTKTTSGCRWYATSTNYTLSANPTQANVMHIGDLA